MAGLRLTVWPNPVGRTHGNEQRWYFHASVREESARHVHLYRYRGEWYDTEGRLRATKEEALDIHLAPLQCLAYADLWVTSALPRFRYRLLLFGRDEQGKEVQAEAVLQCH
ncbi:MAG: hypothetical protein KatS3mg131_1701 [Candidatus Tectimicrobiota bacterium]|nr:MAG: hypothetical protein KatS3mg131_1701 [Candidatus Tectomicrobia bacterium]